MATYGEMVYMCLDILKESSKDSFYTEDHILFLLKKMRALLLERKYKTTRNGVHQAMSDENTQQICLSVGPSEIITSGCEGKWLVSSEKIPELLNCKQGVTCTGHDLLPTMVTFISHDRMPYVGYNKWLKNIIYAARSVDGHLYLHGQNPQFVYLQMVGLTGVFSDPEEAEMLSHDIVAGETQTIDIMKRRFPLESSLVPQCIELVLQELSGARYAPEDAKNDSKDNLSDAGLLARTPVTAARRASNEQDNEQ